MDTNSAREIGIVKIYATNVKRLKFIMGKGNNARASRIDASNEKWCAESYRNKYTTLLPHIICETPRCCLMRPCSRFPLNYLIVDDRVGCTPSSPPWNADILSRFKASVVNRCNDDDDQLIGFSARNTRDYYLYLQ